MNRVAWVRHDLTSAGWRWRSVRRTLAQALVPVVVVAVLPLPVVLRLLVALMVLLPSVAVGAAYADDLRDRRMRQHGLEPPPPARPYGVDDLR